MKSWMDRLKGDDSKKIGQVIELIEEMLVDRHRRIFSWEVEIDLMLIVQPRTPEWSRIILDQLKSVAQTSRKPVNAITNSHNPLMRAIRLERPEEFQMVLRKKLWSDSDPGSTEVLQVHSRPNAKDGSGYFSTLVFAEGSGPLYGRHGEMTSIERNFATANAVGHYGLWGIG